MSATQQHHPDDQARPPFWVAASVCLALVAVMAALHLWVFRAVVLPVGFGVPLVLGSWTRDRRMIWGMAIAFALVAIYRFFWFPPAAVTESAHAVHANYYAVWFGLIVLADLLGVTWVVDVWIRSREALAVRNAELRARNAELADRREEVARSNEELQAQTEELERQGEELRVANEELAGREKTLEALLDLSRSLTTDLSRADALGRICEAATHLLGASAAAVLERRGDGLSVACSSGFGSEGAGPEEIPFDRSFAGIVIAHGRTGYIEDIALRPDLVLPQPRAGGPMKSVLAAPLRVGRQTVGSLEVYGTERQGWTDEQVAILESLAAQTSATLQVAELFERADEERRRLETVQDTVPFGIGLADASCAHITCNAAGAAMMGMAANVPEEMPPWLRKFTLVRGGAESPPEQFPLLLACRGETTTLEEYELQFRTGRRVAVLLSAAPIRDRNGAVIGAVCAFADISAQKGLQRELDLRRREAEEASVRKSRFLAAVSHDIRTPANAISLLAELIQRTATDGGAGGGGGGGGGGEVGNLARELHASAMSLVNLIGDVLDLTRLDTGRVDLQESEFSFGQLVQDEVRQLAPLAEQKQLLFETDVHPAVNGLRVRTDRIKLARVIANLVGNAIKFTEKGGVHVQAQLTRDGAPQLVVKDTGIGIPAEDLPRIFDEFFQLKNPERDKNKGSGLGLSICRRLIDVMGGTLDVKSEEGKGSTFTVTLGPAVVIGGAGPQHPA